MNEIYRGIGTTKQNVHQRINVYLEQVEREEQLLKIMYQIREDHPGMGAVMMHKKLQPEIGRDKFIEFYNRYGFKLKKVKNFRRTTNSNGVIRFTNLIEGFELTGVNQIWVSDITYFEIGGKFYYLTFIMDLYSRKIKGYSASRTLRTVATTIPAMKMAMKYLRKGDKPIIHSDGGGQYYSKEFLALTKGKLHNSMCESVYENSHAERINGTIKNSYLVGYEPSNFNQLQKMLKKAVEMYNRERPHSSLGKLTPDQFEKSSLSYSQKTDLSTKEKRSKKENL